MMMNRRNWMAKIVWIVPLVLLAIAAFVYVTMSLWNWLVPDLFHGPELTFWQTFGLLVLSKIIFSGFGKRSHGHYGGPWKPYWKQRWSNMSDEDRERFKQKMKEKWCGWGEKPSAQNSDAPKT